MENLQDRIDALEAENRSLREQLREADDANHAKEVFLSNMSHDIRTPMNAIVGMTALAKKHIDEKTRVSDALNKIETASTHLLGLINDILDMSRINSGKLKLLEEPFSLSDLLHDTMTILRPQLEQKGHHYELVTENIFAESFVGDALRLRQIYVNIVNNAVKYTDEGGEISLYVSEKADGERCRLSFVCKDNGIGMSEEFLKRIFEPFERVNSSTISRIEGTGLGMSIVKKLVEAMDGRIDIESTLGEGTCVTISVPLPVEHIQVKTEELADKMLLILEADETLRADYRRYLGEYGISFSLVSTVEEAFNELADADFQNRSFDAVIIGRSQRGAGSALEIAGYLNKSYPGLTLVLARDEDWSELEYRATRCGVHSFIPLPFFRKSLLGALNAALLPEEQTATGGVVNLEGMRILLVEDNLINREIAREILGSTKAEVVSAENGQEAVERYLAEDTGAFDLILMDVQMPVMDGYSASRTIRESGRADARTIPIYAMTANTFAEDIAHARSAGMNGHIAKPIDINALMQTLRQLRR